MSTKQTVTISCDGPEHASPDFPAEHTLRVSLGNQEWDKDLCEAHKRIVTREFAPFVEAARPAGKRPPQRDRSVAAELRKLEIRDWARGQGMAVKDRGRIPEVVLAKYAAAHGGRR